MDKVHFFYPYRIKINEAATSDWLLSVAKAEGKGVGLLSIHFLSDPALLELNKKYLNHDYETDVLTFDSSINESICGDIMISVDRTRDNAEFYGLSPLDELCRVMVHGLLHLLGYDDKAPEALAAMRKKEDHYLTLRPF